MTSLALSLDLQYGFRVFRSTADVLTVLSERIYNSLDAGGETRAIALDISKAFVKVLIAGLLHKLKAYGVGILESFFYYFFYLFSIFIIDFPDEVLSRIGIYVDDTTIPVLVSLFFLEGGIGW